MAIRRGVRRSVLSAVLQPGTRLWILRMLVPLGGYREFINDHGFNNEALAEAIGLGHWIDPPPGLFAPELVLSELRKLHKECEAGCQGKAAPTCLSKNMARLSQIIGMTDCDRRILEFAVSLHNDQLLDDTADWVGGLSSMKLFHVLSQLLDIPEPEVRASLGPQGILARSGMLTVDRRGETPLRSKLDLLSNHFSESIYSIEADPISLLRETIAPTTPPQLTLGDYRHLGSTLPMLLPYLKKSLGSGRKGVNIYIHGVPGTGKTQLAKVLAAEMACELFEIASEDGDGDPVGGEQRLRAFRAAQSFFAHRQSLLLFDEVEDVFDNGENRFSRRSTAQSRKAWVNRMLEENPVPTIWISNSLNGLDPAFVRRFDMIFELPVPPRKDRLRILLDSYSDLLDATSASRIAESEVLAPAVLSKAASAVRSISDVLGAKATSAAFQTLIDSTLQAQGHESIQKGRPHRLPETYDPAFIHADTDLTQVADGLITAKAGRLCLYGPPGTGKTAYGRWLAEQLGIPLVVKRVSDLISKWVGESERNIAHAFRQAEREGALLIIDEVDSFLRDRRGAARGWEATLVNEMLTQMESFSGIFIASTNLMDSIDQAALRRFDLKVKFDFLLPEQAAGLLCRHCDALELGAPGTEDCARVQQLRQLTPGDFATIMRQHRFRRFDAPAMVVNALAAECAVKEGAKAQIGFIR